MKKKLNLFQKKNYRIIGTLSQPRLSIFRSNKHIYAQFIDDEHQITLLADSTLKKAIKIKKKADKLAAFSVGQSLGSKALLKGIFKAILSLNHRPYRGLIKSLVEGVRSTGIVC